MVSDTLKVRFFGVSMKKIRPILSVTVVGKGNGVGPLVQRYKEKTPEDQELDPEKLIELAEISVISITDQGNGFSVITFTFVIGGEKTLEEKIKEYVLELFRSLCGRNGRKSFYYKPTEEIKHALISYQPITAQRKKWNRAKKTIAEQKSA